jgi:hypothetical protein
MALRDSRKPVQRPGWFEESFPSRQAPRESEPSLRVVTDKHPSMPGRFWLKVFLATSLIQVSQDWRHLFSQCATTASGQPRSRHQRLLKSGYRPVTPGTLASGLAQIG